MKRVTGPCPVQLILATVWPYTGFLEENSAPAADADRHPSVAVAAAVYLYSTSIYIEEREATSTFGVPFQSVRYALSTRGDFRKPAFCNIVISL